MNRRRIETLERQFQLTDDEPGLDVVVREANQLCAWVVERGFGNDFEPDFHAALAASLKTPERFRYATLEKLAFAEEDCTLYRWVAEWGYVLQARQRLTDPRYDTDYFREHLNSQIERCTRDAQEARAKLASWGVSVADALERARAMYTETRTNGSRMPVDEFDRIAAAIREAETKRVKQQA